MYELNHEISKWRNILAGSEGVRGADIDELENHLREEISHLVKTGLTQQEAFLVSRHRLGGAGLLAGEFAKVNGHSIVLKRFIWMMAGILGYLLAVFFAGAISRSCVLLSLIAGVRDDNLKLVEFGCTVLALFWIIFLFYILCKIADRDSIHDILLRKKVRVVACFISLLGMTAILLITRSFSSSMLLKMLGTGSDRVFLMTDYMKYAEPVLVVLLIAALFFLLITRRSNSESVI